MRATILILTAVLSSLGQADVGICERHATRPPALQMAKGLVKEIPWQDYSIHNQQTRVSERDRRGNVMTVHNATFEVELEEGLHRTSTTYFASTRDRSDEISIRPGKRRSFAQWGLAQFREAKKKALDFVIPIYRERREHWGTKFLDEKLPALADAYEAQSVYINLENKPWPDKTMREASAWYKPFEMVGTIRLIEEKNGMIPMEEYLGLTVLATNKLKVEPGNFAVAREANEIASVELAIQMISQARRYKDVHGKEPLFVTYADRFSEILYRQLGFEYMPPEMLKAQLGELPIDEDGVVRVHKPGDEGQAGVKWAPIYATYEMLVKTAYLKLEKIAQRQASAGLARQLKNAVQRSTFATEKVTSSLGFGQDRVIWEVQREYTIGEQCPQHAIQYDDIAYRVVGNAGFVCYTCDHPKGDATRLIVARGAKCNTQIECHAGICE